MSVLPNNEIPKIRPRPFPFACFKGKGKIVRVPTTKMYGGVDV